MALTKIYNRAWTDDSTWIITTPSEEAKEALLYVQEVGQFNCLPSYYTEHENIPSFLIIYTLSGEGEYRFRNQTWHLAKGDILFADCMEFHSFTPARSGKWDIIWLQFNGQNANYFFKKYSLLTRPVTRIGDDSSIPSLMQQLIDVNRSRSAYAELESSKLITLLLTELLIRSDAIVTGSSKMPDYIHRALRIINTHYNDPITLDSLEAELGVSRFHLERSFRHYIGFTPIKYLQLTRIHEAQNLLRLTNLSVSEIALRTGFQSASYFNNAFRKVVGTTPKNYRNQT